MIISISEMDILQLTATRRHSLRRPERPGNVLIRNPEECNG